MFSFEKPNLRNPLVVDHIIVRWKFRTVSGHNELFADSWSSMRHFNDSGSLSEMAVSLHHSHAVPCLGTPNPCPGHLCRVIDPPDVAE